MENTKQSKKELARRMNEKLWGEGDLDLIDAHISEEYVEYNSASPEPIEGRKGYKANVKMIRGAFPDLDAKTEHVIVEDDRVVNHFTLTGTHQGEIMGIEPTGKSVEFSGIHIGKLDNGELAKGWCVINISGLMQQLGVMEGPGE